MMNQMKHHNSSTFYQDANYHNQIVNEPSSFKCGTNLKTNLTNDRNGTSGFKSLKRTAFDEKYVHDETSHAYNTHFPDSER